MKILGKNYAVTGLTLYAELDAIKLEGADYYFASTGGLISVKDLHCDPVKDVCFATVTGITPSPYRVGEILKFATKHFVKSVDSEDGEFAIEAAFEKFEEKA